MTKLGIITLQSCGANIDEIILVPCFIVLLHPFPQRGCSMDEKVSSYYEYTLPCHGDQV